MWRVGCHAVFGHIIILSADDALERTSKTAKRSARSIERAGFSSGLAVRFFFSRETSRSRGFHFTSLVLLSSRQGFLPLWSFRHDERRRASQPFARVTMSDAPSAPPRDGITVTPPRAARIPPLDPDTPESQAPNPHHASNNAGPGQQPQRTGGFGATGAASSEATPPKREDEEDAEQHDVNRTHVSSDTPAADVAAVARLAREDDRARADADEQRDEPAEDVPMAESGDEALGREADLADEHAHDESAEDTDADERDDVDETEDEDMADPRPERWSFLDLRGGHHALDLYHEVRLVVFLARGVSSTGRDAAPQDAGSFRASPLALFRF
jgi:hypothetical protein